MVNIAQPYSESANVLCVSRCSETQFNKTELNHLNLQRRMGGEYNGVFTSLVIMGKTFSQRRKVVMNDTS